jgi:hypothetical protein
LPHTLTSPTFGLELVSRAAFEVLYASVNAEIAVQASTWAPSDVAFANARGVAYSPVVLEPIESENFFEGHHPSLLDGLAPQYPNLTVMANEAQPRTEAFDQTSSYDIELVVELMVKADTEDLVSPRIRRTADAVNNVLSRDRTLKGVTFESTTPPRLMITDVMAGREERGDRRQRRWWWSGARLEYAFARYSNVTSL